MAFGIGTGAHKGGGPDMSGMAAGLENAGRRKSGGRFQEVAVKCWFTSAGRAIPLMFKYMDDGGELHAVDNIHVVYSEKLLYAGVPFYEYHCTTIREARQYAFVLRFYPERCAWQFQMI